MIKTASTLTLALLLPVSASAETYIQATFGGASNNETAMPYVASGTIGRRLGSNLSLELDLSVSLGEAYSGLPQEGALEFNDDQSEARLLSSSLMLSRFFTLSKGSLCTDMYLKTGLAYQGFDDGRSWDDPLSLRLGPSVGMGFRYGLRENSDLIADLTHVNGDNRVTFGFSRSF